MALSYRSNDLPERMIFTCRSRTTSPSGCSWTQRVSQVSRAATPTSRLQALRVRQMKAGRCREQGAPREHEGSPEACMPCRRLWHIQQTEFPAWPPRAPTLTPEPGSSPEVYHVAQGGARVGRAGRQVGQGVAAQGTSLVRLCREAYRQVGLPGSYRQLHQVGVRCLPGRGRKRREPAGIGASTVDGRAAGGGLTVGWWQAAAKDKELWRCVAQYVLPLSSSFSRTASHRVGLDARQLHVFQHSQAAADVQPLLSGQGHMGEGDAGMACWLSPDTCRVLSTFSTGRTLNLIDSLPTAQQ